MPCKCENHLTSRFASVCKIWPLWLFLNLWQLYDSLFIIWRQINLLPPIAHAIWLKIIFVLSQIFRHLVHTGDTSRARSYWEHFQGKITSGMLLCLYHSDRLEIFVSQQSECLKWMCDKFFSKLSNNQAYVTHVKQNIDRSFAKTTLQANIWDPLAIKM